MVSLQIIVNIAGVLITIIIIFISIYIWKKYLSDRVPELIEHPNPEMEINNQGGNEKCLDEEKNNQNQ